LRLAESRRVNLLALDTSTEVFSLAVRHGAEILERQGPGGASASSTLIPAIQALLAQAGLPLERLDAIVFGRGPGSFTGLRTACSVAQGLAFGAQVPVLGVDTLLAVAEDARSRTGATEVVAVLDARMEQVYWAAYRFAQGAWREERPIALAAPEDVVVAPGWTLAGNAFASHGQRLPAGSRVDAQPTAGAMLRLAPALLAAGGAGAADQALPLYISDKVAQTTEERAAARAAPPSSP
jgi:tRNA threonylcarbamoyladenosine biosynthesis protein TsaB